MINHYGSPGDNAGLVSNTCIEAVQGGCEGVYRHCGTPGDSTSLLPNVYS